MNYVAIVFTPNTVSGGLVDSLLLELSKTVVFNVILRQYVSLVEQDIKIIYPKLVNTIYFPMIVECLTLGRVEIIIIVATEHRMHEKINELKGKFDFSNSEVLATGLRLKYCKNNKIFDFVFHSTDSNKETFIISNNFLQKINNF